MPNLKQFFQAAKSGSTVVATIIGQTVGTGGALSDGTTGSIKGQFKKWRITSSPTKDNISSNDSDRANNVIIEENLRLEIEEMQMKGTGSQVSNTLASNYDVFKCTFGYAGHTYGPVYMSRGEFSDGIQDKGNGTLSLVLDLVDVGQTSVLPYAEA